MDEQYVIDLYNYLKSTDDSFESDISEQQFLLDMADTQYAAQIYQYLGNLDETFKAEVDINQFLIDVGVRKTEEELPPLDGTVKKKDESDSTSLDGSAVSPNATEADIIENTVTVTKPTIDGQLKNDTTIFELITDIDPNQITPRDTREDSYVNPVTALGMYPEGGSDAVQRAYAQQWADIQHTSKLIKEEEPELLETQAQERASKKAKGEEAIARNREIFDALDPRFDLTKIDEAAIDLEEDEAVSYFNDAYGQFGFTFRPIGIGDAMEASILLPNGEIKKEEIDLQPFFDSSKTEEVEKLKGFVKTYAMSPDDTREQVQSDFITASIKAKNLRATPRVNPDGTESTVLFESGIVDGKYVVYPTLS
jgi:hypothetical protein